MTPVDGDQSGSSRRTTRRPDAAGALAAGAARASGERERRRRRTTPLISEAAPVRDPEPAAEPEPQQRPPRAPRRPLAAVRAITDAEISAAAETIAQIASEVSDVRAEPAPGDVADDASESAVEDWERTLAEALAFLRRRLTGDYDVDDFGFDPELTDRVIMSLARPLYRRWFRVEVRGIENVPAEGAALVVANHSGTVPLDALMTQLAVLDEHPARRHLRLLGADLVFQLPFIGELARKSGTTLACNEDAERLLRAGEVVGVWPEGFKGIGKPFSERYRLQRFGRGGFVSAALRAGAPIVPCSIVGAEETYPILANLKTVARLLGLPYAPVTPTFPWLGLLGAVPLPSKWIIEFGEPVTTEDLPSGAAEDPMLVFDLTDRVRETIQHTLYKLLMSRRSVFF